MKKIFSKVRAASNQKFSGTFMIGLLMSLVFVIGSSKQVSGRQTGFGGSIIYNFQAEGFGADLRAKVPVYRKLFIVPEVSYYPSFNEYHEYYAGAAAHYEIIQLKKFVFYLAAGAYFNNWINADDFAPGRKLQFNFSPQLGGGIVKRNGCLRPFLENRYDFKWKEDNIRIGILIYPGACGSKKEKCPKINNY